MNKKALAIFLAALLVASTVSCGKKDKTPMTPDTDPPENQQPGDPGDPGEKPNNKPEDPKPNENAGITLNKEAHEMKVGEEFTIIATFIPEFDTDSKTLSYTISDTAILSVTDDGVVTALAAGSATVTVENDGGKYQKTITFTVTEDEEPPVDPPADNPVPDHTEYLTLSERMQALGNLILVNPDNSTDLTEGVSELLLVHQHKTSTHLRVSLSKHKLEKEALDALSRLANDYFDALSAGGTTPKDILISDAFRSPEDQQEMIDNNTDTTEVGHSDFQTGLSVNLKFFDGTFTYFIGDNAAAAETAWLMEHYAEYGFILRYPAGKKEHTGYDASKSHFRYVGVPHSLYIKEHGISLEEYVELLKGHSMKNPLTFTAGDKQYSVYYVASQGQSTTLPIPVFDREVAYSYSGNNQDGYIVAVEAHWEEDSFDPSLPTPNENPGITLDKTEHTLKVDGSYALGAVFVPLYDTDNKTLTFISSDTTIATVDENGVVTALAEGSVTITVKNHNGKYTATCRITVEERDPVLNENPGITLESTELSLKTGDYHQLNAVFVPTYDTDNTTLIYSVDGRAVTVDGTGKIFAKEVGTATVTVKNLDGTYTATVTVTVEKGANIDAGITLEKDSITMEEDGTADINASFLPKYDTDDTTLTYISSDETIATVDANGKITALKYGRVTITIQNADGEYTATLNVTVTEKPDANAGIILDKTEIVLEIGKTDKITPTFTTEFDNDSQMLIYASSDPTIATVTGLGKINALKAGIVTITVKDITGKFSAKCTVKVPNPAAKLTLDKTSVTLMEENKVKITATFIPVYETDSMILTYTSSDTSILTVDINGNITAIHYGSATVTVTNQDGSFKAECVVTVTEKPDPNAGISLDKSEITLEVGKNTLLGATFIPVYDADSTELTFVSSNDNIATVDTNGKITAIKAGIITITVKNADGKFTKTCTVKIPNPDAGITVENSEITLEEGQSGKVNATFTPLFEADDKSISFTSSDESILKINADGSFTTLTYGKVTVTVMNSDGEFTATVTVTVTEKPDPNAGLTLDKSELVLEEGQGGKINATFVPVYDADSTKLTFVSSDESILKVNDDGSFTTLTYGKVTVTVKNADGKFTATVTVTVTEKPDPNAGITLDKSEIKLQIGASVQLNATFVPVYDADSTILSYTSSDETIATVDANGKITAKKAGTVTITVKNAGEKFEAKCTVRVANPGAGVVLEQVSLELNKGFDGKIKASLIPVYDNDDLTLTFTSSDNTIVSVDNQGNVKALGHGKVTITVTNNDGSLKAICTVMVPNPDAGITSDKTELTIDVDKTDKITATYVPRYEDDDMTLIYTVLDSSIAKVDANGVVTGLAAGTTEITVKVADSNIAPVKITVTVNSPIPANPNATLVLDKEEIILHVTGNMTATITVTEHIPEYETNKTITYESSDTGIVTVNENGVLIAVKAGTATITVRNGNLSATCKVTVTSLSVGTDDDNSFGDFIPYV